MGEKLAEKGEKKREKNETTKELQPGGGEDKEGASLEEGSNGVSAQPDRLQTPPPSSDPGGEKDALVKEIADGEEEGGLQDQVVAEEPGEDGEDIDDYMDPADAIPQSVTYDL